MLKEEHKQEVIKRLGLNEDTFAAFAEAINSEEEKQIELPDIHTFTPEEFTAFKENTKKTKQPAWVEEQVKLFRQKHNLTLKSDSLESLFNVGKELGEDEGKKEPNQKFDELKGKYEVALSDIENLENVNATLKGEMFTTSAKSTLSAAVDFDTSISTDEIYTLYSSKNEVGQDGDGDLRVKKKGAEDWAKTDRYEKVLAVDDFVQFAEKFKSNGTIRKPKGGGDDYDPENPTFKTQAEFNKWVEKEKPDRQKKGKALLASQQKNPQFFD